MEHYLADVCNTILLNNSVCQAFDYSTDSNIAYFKGQAPSGKINWLNSACVIPNVTLWVLSSGQLKTTCLFALKLFS